MYACVSFPYRLTKNYVIGNIESDKNGILVRVYEYFAMAFWIIIYGIIHIMGIRNEVILEWGTACIVAACFSSASAAFVTRIFYDKKKKAG